ncbi:MAG: hypothetical protein HW421_3322 [Ignavibacteria bacterium]|nr:hypothetical protein [Ignavibacteria bacterium]
MPDKTALIIAYYFPPMGLSGVQRTLKFVKYLPEHGWNVVVLTATPHSYYAFDESLLEEINRPEIKIFATAPSNKNAGKRQIIKFPSYFKQKLGRAVLQTFYVPDSKIKWKAQAVALGEKILKSYDINAIFATAPPFTDFLIAKELAVKFGKPFIMDYRDIWVDNPFHFYPTIFHKNKNIKLEAEMLKHSEKAIVTTRYAKELLLKRYRFLSHEDIAIIPHGYDSSDFADLGGTRPPSDKFVITHSGVFQDNRTPGYFFQALASFIKKNPEAKGKIEARFVGIMRPGHIKLIKKYGLEDNVVLTGYVSHQESVRHLAESHVLWLMLDDNVRSPGKLYEYFGARKPLLVCAPDGIIRRTALDCGATVATNPKDVKAIEKSIKDYYYQWKNRCLPVPEEEYIASFDRFKLTGDLARELALAVYI